MITSLKQCLLLVLLAAPILWSCTRMVITEGAEPGLHVREPSAPQAGIRLNTVNILDKSLQNGKGGKIAVETTNARRTPTGTVEVWATLRNRTQYPLTIEGRAQFMDAGQAPVEGPTAWQRVFLPANGVATYKEISTRVMDIGYYYIEIQESR